MSAALDAEARLMIERVRAVITPMPDDDFVVAALVSVVGAAWLRTAAERRDASNGQPDEDGAQQAEQRAEIARRALRLIGAPQAITPMPDDE